MACAMAECGFSTFFEHERSSRRLTQREQIEVHDIGDVDGRPAVQTPTDIMGSPGFPCLVDQERKLNASGLG